MNFISQFLVSIYTRRVPVTGRLVRLGPGAGNDIISLAIVLELYLGDNEEWSLQHNRPAVVFASHLAPRRVRADRSREPRRATAWFRWAAPLRSAAAWAGRRRRSADTRAPRPSTRRSCRTACNMPHEYCSTILTNQKYQCQNRGTLMFICAKVIPRVPRHCENARVSSLTGG